MAATSSSSTNGDNTDRISRSSSSKKKQKVSRRRPDLPLEVTEKILCCISLLESARLATVCKSWASTVSARLTIPHIFLYTPRDDANSDRCGHIVSVALDGTIGAAARHPPLSATVRSRVRSEDTKGLQCIGATPSGRLAFKNWWSLRLPLVNPVTGAVSEDIRIRQQRRVVVVAGGRRDSFLSSKDDNKLVLNWQDGAGRRWTSQTLRTAPARQIDKIVSVASCNGCFYALHKNGDVWKIDDTVPGPLVIDETVPAVEGLIDDDDQHFVPRATYLTNGHLLESDGEVLFVRRLLIVSKEVACPFCNHSLFDSVNVGFEVYRLDAKDRRWDKVGKLAGDRALFVSPASSFAVRASEMVGCMSNCVYFIKKKRYCSLCEADEGNTWGVYSMEERKVLFEYVFTEPGSCSAAMWFVPSVV
ncbi:hypothetical protein EJB05_46472, partial [Eragrostis curvula]